jgi:hypothetical protein
LNGQNALRPGTFDESRPQEPIVKARSRVSVRAPAHEALVIERAQSVGPARGTPPWYPFCSVLVAGLLQALAAPFLILEPP